MENEKLTSLLKNTINKKLVYLIIALALIPLLLLVVSKFTPKNRTISKLNSFSNEINICNDTLKDAINDKSINTSNAIDILSSGILTLDSIKDNINSTEFNESYADLKASFKKTLDYNISLYEISLSILKDPKSNELSNKYTSLNSTLELFNECSTNLDALGINYTLSDYSKIFFLNMKYYTNALIKLNRDSDIINNQKRNYIMEIEKCLSSFEPIKQDLKPAIDKVKEDGRNLTVIIDDINAKKSSLESIKKSFNLLSIPENGRELYNSLSESINAFNVYIFALEKAVVLDGSDNNKSDSLYSDAYDKYSSFLKSLNLLKKQVDNFKAS